MMDVAGTYDQSLQVVSVAYIRGSVELVGMDCSHDQCMTSLDDQSAGTCWYFSLSRMTVDAGVAKGNHIEGQVRKLVVDKTLCVQHPAPMCSTRMWHCAFVHNALAAPNDLQ